MHWGPICTRRTEAPGETSDETYAVDIRDWRWIIVACAIALTCSRQVAAGRLERAVHPDLDRSMRHAVWSGGTLEG